MRNAIEQILGEIEAGRFREAGALIERSVRDNPQELVPYRRNLANWLVLAANWPLVSQLLLPGPISSSSPVGSNPSGRKGR